MISLIVAKSQNNVIGQNNQLPWHLSEDLKHFKATTMNHPILMGRKTFDSIGRALPGRENIVVTRNTNYKNDAVTVIHDLEAYLKDHQNTPDKIFVIGGSRIYEQSLNYVSEIVMTVIENDFEGDAYFPDLDSSWSLKGKSDTFVSEKSGLKYHFETWTQVPSPLVGEG